MDLVFCDFVFLVPCWEDYDDNDFDDFANIKKIVFCNVFVCNDDDEENDYTILQREDCCVRRLCFCWKSCSCSALIASLSPSWLIVKDPKHFEVFRTFFFDNNDDEDKMWPTCLYTLLYGCSVLIASFLRLVLIDRHDLKVPSMQYLGNDRRMVVTEFFWVKSDYFQSQGGRGLGKNKGIRRTRIMRRR